MRNRTESDSHIRRSDDFPILVVSQDYELFFRQSGSIERCLFEPTDMLLDFADQSGIQITFFVDAGMLCRMQEMSSNNSSIAKSLSKIQRHIESLHTRGHEIGLHIHPHWEDTRFVGDAWDFTDTRYQLRDFSASEVSDIVTRYTKALKQLCDGNVSTYRAGGFCVEPFDTLAEPLLRNGITVDSSVIPGARLKDPVKGFDFSIAPDKPWWRFDDSPLQPHSGGKFLEIPVTPLVLPLYHYWGRAIDRALGRQPTGVIGDGSSKAIAKVEIIRRLSGTSRISELSIDVAKADQLLSKRLQRKKSDFWQVMGHPKLLGKSSLLALQKFIDRKGIRRFESLSNLAAAIHDQGL